MNKARTSAPDFGQIKAIPQRPKVVTLNQEQFIKNLMSGDLFNENVLRQNIREVKEAIREEFSYKSNFMDNLFQKVDEDYSEEEDFFEEPVRFAMPEPKTSTFSAEEVRAVKEKIFDSADQIFHLDRRKSITRATEVSQADFPNLDETSPLAVKPERLFIYLILNRTRRKSIVLTSNTTIVIMNG